MKTRFLIIILIGIIGSVGIPYSDAFNGGGIIEVPGQIMDISQNIISPGETMFVNGSFKQHVDDFTTNIFKNYEDSSKLVLTLNPDTSESGDFSFNFTIPEHWEVGNYYMVLENGIQSMDWNFGVRQNYVGASLDPIVYPIPQEILSPLKQFKSGVLADEIQCRESLTLVTKNNGSPACVKEQTLLKLVERKLIISSIAERDLMLDAGYKLYPGVGWVPGVTNNELASEPEPEPNPIPEGNYADKNTYVYSINDAESYLNYTLGTPYLPEGTELEKIKISNDRRKATLYYSNGLEVSHHPMGINFNNTHYKLNPEREEGKIFYDLRGTFAEGYEIDEPNRPHYSTIIIHRDDRIYVRATMDIGLGELLKMIEPMDLNVPHVPYTPTLDYVMGAPEPEPIPEPEPENED
ncbi:hypothetical protein C6990_09535 [Nitrosopumilus sp. b3]|uniref:hypothetical protein n=1 Tax=Nitrosopumilus sp. b3 TaxID=2109909 RepID=UPI0015F663B3|nr:hypothetical protein [Nitrosopumilus sp. b3]KAF6246359.1 hypothetical protein C6990_09535 [Nitrosopumilus sp. b3]